MNRKTILCTASVLLCALAFSPSLSFAHGHCPYSKKGGEKSFWSRITGGGEEHGEKKPGCHKGKHGYKKCGHGKRGAGAFWWRSVDMAERLRLTDEQVEDLDEVAASGHDEIAAAYDEVFEAKHRFKKVMRNPESSADEIKAAAEEKYAAMIEKKRARLEMHLAMREIMTDEQIMDLSVLKRKWRKGCEKTGH